MDTYTLVVDRRPKVKARPRHTKGGKVFTPASTLQEEDHVAAAWKDQVGETISGPVEITVVYSPEATLLHVTSERTDMIQTILPRPPCPVIVWIVGKMVSDCLGLIHYVFF